MGKLTIVAGMTAMALALGLQALPSTIQGETDEWLKTLSVEVNDEKGLAEINDEKHLPRFAESDEPPCCTGDGSRSEMKDAKGLAEVNDDRYTPRFAEVNDDTWRA